jgi:hypothetical protein
MEGPAANHVLPFLVAHEQPSGRLPPLVLPITIPSRTMQSPYSIPAQFEGPSNYEQQPRQGQASLDPETWFERLASILNLLDALRRGP